MAAGLYTHYFAVFHCMAQGSVLLYHAAVQRRREYALIAVAPVLVFLPWCSVFAGQAARVREDYWIAPLTWHGVGNLLWQLWAADDLPAQAWQGATAVALLLVGLWCAWMHGGLVGRVAAAHVAATLGLALLVSAVWRSILMPRYLAPAHVLLLCGLASGWPSMKLAGRVAMAFSLTAQGLLLAGLWDRLVPPPDTGMRAAVEWVSNQRGPNDSIGVTHPLLYWPWRFYDRDGAARLTESAFGALTHYQGLPLIRSDDRVADAVVPPPGTIWMVGANRGMAPDVPSAGRSLAQWRQFSEAFSWQSPVVVEQYVAGDR